MLCRIADLLTEIPEVGGLAPRCKEYLHTDEANADITISAEKYRYARYPYLTEEDIAYVESAAQFYAALLQYDGFYLHSSAVAVDGKAYLFSADPGVGKSTHARLWQTLFGERAQVINDDKPALRLIDGVWYAFGTPWCGKDGININMKVPLAGICFLEQAKENQIRRLRPIEAIPMILSQTIRQFGDEQGLDLLLGHLDRLVDTIPVYKLRNLPQLEAAALSYETMRCGAEESGL